MFPNFDVLVITDDIANRQRIAEEFKNQKFRINICCANTQKEAINILEYNDEKKSFVRFPELILLDSKCPSGELLEKIRLDPKYNLLSLFLLVDSVSDQKYKYQFSDFRIDGFVDRNFVFNDYSTSNYLDVVELHIKILKLGLQHKFNHNCSGNV